MNGQLSKQNNRPKCSKESGSEITQSEKKIITEKKANEKEGHTQWSGKGISTASKQKRTFSSQSNWTKKGWNFNWKSFYNLNTVLQLVHPARSIALKFSTMRTSQCVNGGGLWSMYASMEHEIQMHATQLFFIDLLIQDTYGLISIEKFMRIKVWSF